MEEMLLPVEIISGRNNPHIDPSLQIWGWEIPVYLFLGGAVAGLMILLPLLEMRRGRPSAARGPQWMPFLGLFLISLGMGVLFLDLEHKKNVLYFYLSFQPSSPMSWGSWILLLVYPSLLLLGLGGLDAGLRERLPAALMKLLRFAQRRRQGLLWLSLLTGISLGTYTGLLLGTMVARVQWNTAALGPLFLASGISSGAALLMLSPLEEAEEAWILRYDSLAIASELLLLAIMIISFLNGCSLSQFAAHNLMTGEYQIYFWTLIVGLGLALPLALNLLEIKDRLRPGLITPILVLLGGLALRSILIASQGVSFGA